MVDDENLHYRAQPARSRRDELYDKYLAVPDHRRAEIVHDTLHVMPCPAPRYAAAATVLHAELSAPYRHGRGGPGGWWILREPELQLVRKEPVVPDLAGWRVAHVPELPDTIWFTRAPDWVCEVLSPATETFDRHHKLPYYAEHGVPHAWLVDPIDHRLEAYVLHAPTRRWEEVHIERQRAVRMAPFEAVVLDLVALWGAPARLERDPRALHDPSPPARRG